MKIELSKKIDELGPASRKYRPKNPKIKVKMLHPKVIDAVFACHVEINKIWKEIDNFNKPINYFINLYIGEEHKRKFNARLNKHFVRWTREFDWPPYSSRNPNLEFLYWAERTLNAGNRIRIVNARKKSMKKMLVFAPEVTIITIINLVDAVSGENQSRFA